MANYDFPDEDEGEEDEALERAQKEFDAKQAASPERLAAARIQARTAASAGSPSVVGRPWLPLGPAAAARAFGSPSPEEGLSVAGRVRDVALSPDGQRAYAASANGGVWYSADRGLSWEPVGLDPDFTSPADREFMATLSCGCLLVEFATGTAPHNDVVYVGTGEASPARTSSPAAKVGGVGVLRLAGPIESALTQPNPWQREAEELNGKGIYRLAENPHQPGHLVAATSAGLFERTTGASGAASWRRVAALGETVCTDVAWVRLSAAEGRLWVARPGAGLGHQTTGAGPLAADFEFLALPGVVPNTSSRLSRLAFATTPANPQLLYVLGKGPRVWQAQGTTVQQIAHVPSLFGSRDQSAYDMAIAAHPTDARLVALGGSAVGRSAAIFMGRLTEDPEHPGALRFPFDPRNEKTPTKDATFVGSGVHPDVHQLRFVVSGANTFLWVTCDGGVYASESGGAASTFASRNQGLVNIETLFVANHPWVDGIVVAGTQDNGAMARTGDTLYTLNSGDGGGVAFHPRFPSLFVRQFFNGHWGVQQLSGGNGPSFIEPLRPSRIPSPTKATVTAMDTEMSKRSAFYSGLDVAGSASHAASLAVGTHRVWLSDTWNPLPGAPPMTWVTLPSNTDPYGANRADLAQDALEGETNRVLRLRFKSRDELFVLARQTVLKLTRGTPQWARWIITHGKLSSDNPNSVSATEPLEYLPYRGSGSTRGSWTNLCLYSSAAGEPLGDDCIYVTTTGEENEANFDNLYFFDGKRDGGKWYPTGLNHHCGTVAHCVVCDPENPHQIYVGTSTGVWAGTLSFDGERPQWQFAPEFQELPDGPVTDLAFFYDPTDGTKLLRAATRARGLWELDLSRTPMPLGRTFLRIAKTDSRRRPPPRVPSLPEDLLNPLVLAPRDNPFESPFPGLPPPPPPPPEAVGHATGSWTRSPDLKLQPLPLPAGQTLRVPAALATAPDALSAELRWVLQTALCSRDGLCLATGELDQQFRARIAALGLPPTNPPINLAVWNHVMGPPPAGVPPADHFQPFFTPWHTLTATPEPTEVDLARLLPLERGRFTPGIESALSVAPQDYRAIVLVHHRAREPLPPSEVRVLVLSRVLAGTTTSDSLDFSDAWKAFVVSRLTGTSPTAPDGSWQELGLGQPTQPLDALHPRPVMLDLNVTAALGAHGTTRLLLAFVHSSTDPISVAALGGATARDVVLSSHHVCACLVQVDEMAFGGLATPTP